MQSLARGGPAAAELVERQSARIAPIEERMRAVAEAGEATHEFRAGALCAAESLARYRRALREAAAGRDGTQEVRDAHDAMTAARTALLEAYEEACASLPLPDASVPPHLEAWRALLLRWMQGLTDHEQVAAVAEALAADLRSARSRLSAGQGVHVLAEAYAAGMEALEAVRDASGPAEIHASWPRMLESFALVEEARASDGGLEIDAFYRVPATDAEPAVERSRELRHARCAPCEGGVPPLGPHEVAELAAACPNWTADATSLERELKFASFAAALAFVNRVGAVAEEQGHHPDITLYSWNRVRLRLSTHAIGGLSRNDFILAAHLDALPSA